MQRKEGAKAKPKKKIKQKRKTQKKWLEIQKSDT